MTRKHPFRPADLDGDRLALYRSITEGPRAQGPRLFDLVSDDGVLLGPFNEFLLRPALGDALQRVGAAVRYAGSLGGRAREMAILVVAAHWDSAFERTAHEAVGRAAGLTDAELAAIAAGAPLDLDDPDEAAVLRLTRALVTGDVNDATWAACVPPLDRETVFELTTLVGYYATLALQMRVFRG
ncbi:4-carboxymuconolactone decarboxylase [Actinomadura coerulea]|uniref:4-carboxymuconolactone decarboxylase n=1 Tax=Actinomadura coerulea TaxID=46159 RepID=A0A7X0KYQ0_9ACTN|nr:carboxymuconolactone decarboxylase family protein [Actinomadura coerulea]MBB6395643.1 4-carboxymuconolactone decarboxylase [Actinomadura coerulea]GGQ24869.1 carboxymuconolactone decarboxylase [Actinomadura coerulea]